MNISENFTPHRETRSGSRSRESTAPLEDNTHDDTSFPRLHLTFNPGPRGSRGLEFGTNPHCDIVLPKLKNKKISRVHCALTFDSKRRLILQDFSRHGTIVEYDGKGGESRRAFVTIGRRKRDKPPFQVDPWRPRRSSRHKKSSSTSKEFASGSMSPRMRTLRKYNANVDRFLQQVKAKSGTPSR